MPKRSPRRKMALACLLHAASPAIAQPVPPPIMQLQVDCTRPQYASDTLICGDAALRAIDADTATLAGMPVALAAAAIWEDQGPWVRRRSLCAFKGDHRACLAAAYADRHAVLVAATTTTRSALSCTGTWRGHRVTAGVIAPGQPMTLRDHDLLLGVAMPANRFWRPFLTWRAAGDGIKLQAQDGRQFSCRPAPG